MPNGVAPWTIHIAGEPIGAYQQCVACGFVLADNTAWLEGRVAVPDADTNRSPTWWPAGQRIGTDKTATNRGGCTYVLSNRDLDDDGRLCFGVN